MTQQLTQREQGSLVELTPEDLARGHLPDGEPLEGWINASGMPSSSVRGSVERLGRELSMWIEGQRNAALNRSSMFDRYAYTAPDNPYKQMEIARNAVANDDIVGGACDVTEGLIFQGLKWESTSADDSDIFNQLSEDLNLDEIARVMHRELFTYSTAIIGEWWGPRSYKVKGVTRNVNLVPVSVDNMVTGEMEVVVSDMTQNSQVKLAGSPTTKSSPRARRKTYDIFCPVAYTFLDPLKVVPVGSLMFGMEQLAWYCSKEEMVTWDRIAEGDVIDAIMTEFFVGKYVPSILEKAQISALGIDPNRLMLLNPERVWRICRTRPDYRRFADVRLKSVFRQLDLKQQLMEADRVQLIGAANYILLIKKGDEKFPAIQPEIDNLKDSMKVLARLPVIVSDHRLNIEIITPKQDMTLNHDKYDVLDRRILSRALGSLQVAASGQRAENSLTMSHTVGRLLENQRSSIKRHLERRITHAVVVHTRNANKFSTEPDLQFVPPHIQLDNDAQITQSILELRQMNELSRDSTLEYFGFDQAVEAQRRESEEQDGYDAIFKSQVPFGSPNAGMAAGAGTAPGAVKPAPSGSDAAGLANQTTGAVGKGATPAKRAATAGPNGAGRTPASSGRSGGRPIGGGTTTKSTARVAPKPAGS
ncbi:MAG TPA: hypothetical protein VII50_09940 [Acidothermaceae bacterium]